MRIALLACAFLCVAGLAAAQTAETRLQDATVVAKGSTISITRLPIRTPSGIIYRDVTIELHATQDGRVTLATRRPAQPAVALRAVPSGQAAEAEVDLPQRASPPVVFQHFRAGTYASTDGSLMQLQDRGMDLLHHVPMWGISADGGAISSATFYSGPPRLNPRARRLRNAGITSEDFAYGTTDSGSGEVFGGGALIGVQQKGDTLRVVSFRHGCCGDGDEPAGSVVYKFVGG